MKKILLFITLMLFSLSTAAFALKDEQLFYCSYADRAFLGVNLDKANEKQCKKYLKKRELYNKCISLNRTVPNLYNYGYCSKIETSVPISLKDVECSFRFNEDRSEIIGYASLRIGQSEKAANTCLYTLAKEVKKNYPSIITKKLDCAKYGFKYVEEKNGKK